MMILHSLNVGRPRTAFWNGRAVSTGIYKTSVPDRRQVTSMNIEGDEQADLRVHGGADKAVYAYDLEHYRYWQTQLDRDDWPMGLFGENLTTEGLPDHEVRIGDVFQIGTTLLQSVQPRFPCYKMNIRFGLPDMLQRFYAAQRPGIYFRVEQSGSLQAGDAITRIERSPYEVTVRDVAMCFTSKGEDRELLQKILALPYLPEGLRKTFERFDQ